ncbi:ATP-binding protein [Mycobacterium avium subsp. hominissuis]|uniref:ATP-binding protein n=1 Tax=Mycobacterium avium TaxID=1764 RepID=UPI001CC4ECEB|nr:STAS domain-containing protein [Mycobacterium avium]MBZ4560886.1 ATP-binding protein [Mycobacterium avium subsp. hominissuis]MBZ4570505.1 ATP-binding protein [Mycobacterium avium subsp. hominissuis]MBZ4588886.1 ATP-binding protein [Mycobacterium avium subsp. hominissuis]MBZ4626422.1 ATP-binding protein [Mycobacterium avium subsp. hominissuis]
MNEQRSAVQIASEQDRDVPVLTVDGVLDSSTYRTVRDTVIKAAIDEPRAVVVDVDRVRAPSASAWTVFTSARWHVSIWPDVPILLVCAHPQTRREITTAGVTRYVPVHPTRELAVRAVHGRTLQVRRRARTELPRSERSLHLARTVLTDWLTQWDIREVIPVAATVATVFVENVLDHTESAPVLIVESHRDTVTVAVEDNSFALPGRHEDADRGADIVSGLAIVAALCRVWGATPTSSGKTVWGSVGGEDRF